MTNRTWDKRHKEGWDIDVDDFTPTYGWSDNLEDAFVKMAINGFSCGYPECCVIDFMRKWWNYVHTRDLEVIKSKRMGITETGQPYAQCEAHL